MRAKLTKRLVDGLPLPEQPRRLVVFDLELHGLVCVASWSGSRTFLLRYQIAGRRREMKLGEHGAITVDAARRKAKEALAAVAAGRDPLQERAAQRGMATWQAWCEGYLEAAAERKAPRSIQEDRRYLLAVASRWKARKLDEISTDDVTRLFQETAKRRGSTTANRALASWRACFADAWRREIIRDNPCARVRPLPENPPRSRVLSDDELQRLIDEVHRLGDPHLRAAFLLMVGTGCRKSEMLCARWDDLDLAAGVWRLPSTKAKRPQQIALTPDLVELLRRLPRVGEYIIPGRTGGARYDLKRPWQALCEAAGIDDVHIHDVRRTYGLLAARKVGIRAASRLLRHSRLDITYKVYAPFDLTEAHEAAAQVATVFPLRRTEGAS